jgi:putative flippase GtrA
MLQDIFNKNDTRFQAMRHLTIGFSGVAINWLTFGIFRKYLGLSTLVSWMATYVILFAYIFPMQKYFTFKENNKANIQIVKYIINTACYMTLDYIMSVLFIDMLKIHVFIGKGMSLLILTPASFLSQKFWVFKNARNKGN